jgi:hypothetical protein
MNPALETGWSAASEAPYSRAELYDALAYGANASALRWLFNHYEVVLRPRERLVQPLQRGDILLRRGESALSHASVVVDPVLRSALDVLMQGGTAEISAPGAFVFIAERGVWPHEEHERFARRVVDAGGCGIGKQVVLRPRASDGDEERVDPLSLMVGMSIATLGARPREVTRVEVVTPRPAEPAWTPPTFESEFAECDNAEHEALPRLGWTASCHSHAHEHGEHADGAGESDSAEFNSPEHFRLGSGIQALVNAWAQRGLVSGGCFVFDTDARTGHVLPISQWRYFIPDRTHPDRPYGDPAALSGAHWHWITPNALNDASGNPWTPETLERAVRAGEALTMSIGDLIMTSGDLVGDFSDYTAAASRGWRARAVNIARGLELEDPFAYALVRRLAFARTGSGAISDIQMIWRAGNEPAAVRTQILDPADHAWAAVRGLVHFLRRAAGTRGYQQLLVLSRLMRKRRITIDTIRSVAPWVTAADSHSLLLETGLAGLSFGNSSSIDDDVFQFVVSNGAYADLALHNTAHFSQGTASAPGNWDTFERAHREALQLVDRLAADTGTRSSPEPGPIPANAIARVAFGLHFLTDAFAAGHMRVPRSQLGPQGSMLSGVMHDLENDLGLTVQNGFRERWRAFGDGHLEHHPAADDAHSAARDALLRELVTASTRAGQPIEPRFDANLTHAMNAVGAAMKQLHYQAQKYFGDATRATQYQEILRANRGSDAGLANDEIQSGARPGDGTSRDAWLAMSLDDKILYMRKHRPVPLPSSSSWRSSGTHNHPPLVFTTGASSTIHHDSGHYTLNQHLATRHVLYELETQNASGSTQDISKYVLLAALTPSSVVSWAGTRETALPAALTHWADDRNVGDSLARWFLGLSGLGLP